MQCVLLGDWPVIRFPRRASRSGQEFGQFRGSPPLFGAVGERIDSVSEEGWSIPPGAVYGVLFDTAVWGPFVSAAAKRQDLTHAFIVTDSIVEYQQIVAKLDPTIKTTRLYADYLRSFAINTSR